VDSSKTTLKARLLLTILIINQISIMFYGFSYATENSNIVIWANDGGDKVTQDELRASTDPNSVVNSVWDGSTIEIFGARNEVINFNLILEAPNSVVNNIEVTISSLIGPEGATISSKETYGNGVFNYVDRNIELFYIRYLEIQGLSTDLAYAGYNYDQRHIPERFGLPYNGYPVGDIGPYEGLGSWEDRPDHNKLYPEIAVPIELETPFNIEKDASQSIWCDIYIPKTTPAGAYLGNINIITEDEEHLIPVSLDVRDFSLPDIPTAKTMLYIGYENIDFRYLGEEYPDLENYELFNKSMSVTYEHFKLAHRHKISIVDSAYYDVTLESPVDIQMQPRLIWLTGELFTPSYGYDGIGVNKGNNVFSIGTYGSWIWQRGTEQDMWDNTDAWVNWFDDQEFETPTEIFLYLIDESSDFPKTEEWAQWMNNNPGPGGTLPSMATLSLPDAVSETPSLDIPCSAGTFGITHEWENSLETHRDDPENKFYVYNGQRPATGTFATEDDGVSPRVIAWTQYKFDIDRWFYWDSTYYNNYQAGMGQTNVFETAQVYGSYERDDIQLGKTGWNYFNGDGVLFYPGTDSRYPEDNYNVDGPFASLRLKNWRRGLQDHDYLSLAAEVNPERVDELVQEIIPKVLWEVGCAEEDGNYDSSWGYNDISWSNDPDIWEAARKELADIIESEDLDGDGLNNGVDSDDDNDTLPDSWEIMNRLDPLNGSDATEDPDQDGVNNLNEYNARTLPTVEVIWAPSKPLDRYPFYDYESGLEWEDEIEEPEEEDESADPDPETGAAITIMILDINNKPVNGVIISSTSQPSGVSTLSEIASSGEMNFTNLQTGSYTFKVMKEGYETTSVSGTVESETSLTLTVYLEKTADPTPNEGSGISGYPNLSIIIGLTLIILYLWRIK
jgi:hypothetical protein